MKAYVLKGWGIECDEELKRAALVSKEFTEVKELVLPKVLRSAKPGSADVVWPFEAGDWVLIPGGFSFSDHFGSGKLLALKLREMGFFAQVEKLGLSLLGICNGFQVLTESGLFGPTTELKANVPVGFKNRWVSLKSATDTLRLPARHGEGRLSWEGELPQGVKPFLHYADEDFKNGSRDLVAGLALKKSSAIICGMMPHPEIALTALDDPDSFATDYFEHHREKLWNEEGAGLKLLRKIFRKEIV